MAKPVVDGIERETSNQARTIRIDVNSSQGTELVQRFGIRGVPTLLVFNGTGDIVLSQVGRINRLEVAQTITQLSTQP